MVFRAEFPLVLLLKGQDLYFVDGNLVHDLGFVHDLHQPPLLQQTRNGVAPSGVFSVD